MKIEKKPLFDSHSLKSSLSSSIKTLKGEDDEMDRKNRNRLVGISNSKLYLDLKDIIRENALQFLPAKSLSRFTSVCRDWKLQISSPFFAHSQSLSCHFLLGFFYQTPGEPPSFLSVDPMACGVPDPALTFLPEPVDIRSSSNGLVLCQGRAGLRPYYVCNPVTKQWKKLPQPNTNHGVDPAIVLIFEPSLLDFEPSYKLVSAITSPDFDDATEFEIYSSKEGEWRISGEICFANVKVEPRSGMYAGGVVFWNSRGHRLLAFDLVKDRAQLLYQYYHEGTGVTVGTMNGKLCSAHARGLSITVSVLDNMHTNTMTMDSRANMWKEVKRVVLDSEKIGGSFSGAKMVKVIFAGSRILLVQVGKTLVSYDLVTGEVKQLSTEFEYTAPLLPYVNSLVNL